jgi:hypothetical protein
MGRVCAAAVAALVVLGAWVLSDARSATPASSTPTAPSADRPNLQPAPPPRPGQTAEVIGRADGWAQAQRRAQWLASPAAAAERRLSRAAFVGLGADRALAVFREHVGGFADEASTDPLRLKPGAQVQQWLSDRAARVRQPDGASTIVLSGTPARAGSKPIDLSLRPVAGGFAPVNDAVPTKIAGDPRDGVQLQLAEGTLGLRPAVADTVSPGVKTGAPVVFANAQADTDFAVRSVGGGVQTWAQLRSPASPETLELDVDLPPGTHLERPGGSTSPVLIATARNTVGVITPAVAWDAQGSAVDVSTELQGQRLVIHVAHRDADVAYPIQVDPYVIVDDRWWSEGLQTDRWWNTSVWMSENSGNHRWQFAFYPGSDLRIGGPESPYAYGFTAGAVGEWYFKAPGPKVRIPEAHLVYQGVSTYLGSGACASNAIIGPLGADIGPLIGSSSEFCSSGDWINTDLCTASACASSGGQTGNYLSDAYYIHASGFPPSFSSWLRNVTITLTDDDNPQTWISGTDHAATSVTGYSPNDPLSIWAIDEGLGVYWTETTRRRTRPGAATPTGRAGAATAPTSIPAPPTRSGIPMPAPRCPTTPAPARCC